MIQRQGAIRDNTRRSGGFVERQRRRWTNLPMSEPTNPKSGEKRKPDDIRQNKHREEENKKRFFLSPKIFAKREKVRSAYRLHRRTCYTKKEPPRRISEVLKVAATYSPTMQRSTIGDAELNDPVRNGKGWDLSAITTLIWGKGER